VGGVSRYMLWKGRESEAVFDKLEDAISQHAKTVKE